MTPDERLQQRKIILVDRRSQIYLALITVAYLVLYTILMFLVILAPAMLKLIGSTSTPEEQYLAGREFLTLGGRAMPVVLVFMVAFAIHFIFISNRIFGPFFRFKRILREWRDGAWPKAFKCRPKDFNEDVFVAFNETTGKLKGDVSFVRDRLRSALEAAHRSSPEATVAVLKTATDECRLAMERLETYRLD